jgi:hypothetical protein
MAVPFSFWSNQETAATGIRQGPAKHAERREKIDYAASPGLNSLSSESRAGSFADGVDGKFGNRDQV